MKNIFISCIGFFCFILVSQAQETDKNDEDEKTFSEKFFNNIESDVYFDTRVISPHAVGKHFLSQAYNQDQLGIDIFLNIYAIHDFRVGIGHSRFGSGLTDASLAGNFKRANYRSYYLQVAYAIFKNKDFETGVSVGYGTNYFRQRTSRIRRGSYSTGEIRSGVYANYQFFENMGISLGVNYLTTNTDSKSAKQSEDLFGRTHVIYPFLGLYYRI